MSRIKRMTASLGAAALITAGLAAVSSGAAHAASGPAVSVTETTTDQSQLLAPQTGASFAPGSSSQSQVITVNPSTTYQTMTGFGASFTDSSAWLVYNSPLRNQIMTKLFDPNQGIGLDFLRQPIGASDFSQSLFSYDDMPAGQTDPTLADFSIAHDQAYIIPVLKQALSINPSHHDHGHAVEPAGLDEDQRLDDRRHPQHRRLPGLRQLPGQVHPGLRRGRGAHLADHRAERAGVLAVELPGLDVHLHPGGELHREQPRAGDQGGRAEHRDPGLRPQLERPELPGDHPRRLLGRAVRDRHGLALLRRGPERPVHGRGAVPVVRDLRDRMLRLAVLPGVGHLRRHARLGAGEPGRRRDPQLQQVRRHLEHGAEPERRAEHELHHLHRARHRRQLRRHRDVQRRVLQPRAGQQVREARRGAHRLQHLRLGQHRGRRLPEPQRLRRAGGAELEHLEREHLRGG